MTEKQLMIQYHKWNKKDRNQLFNSIQEILNIKSTQFYIPLFSLYFYLHNTPKSHKTIDFKRKYYVSQINSIEKERYYNSNMFLKGIVYDSSKQTYNEKDIFCKTISILDPNQFVNNNYNLPIKHPHHLPSNYNFNTFHKINDIDNTAYIDIFCSYLFSELTLQKKNPSFAIFYGSLNGMGQYKYDITEEYHDLITDKCFNKNIGKGFTMEMYIDSDSDSDSDNESTPDDSDNESTPDDSDNESTPDSESSYKDDYVAVLKHTPIQLLFMEKLEGTLEDIIHDKEIPNLNNLLKSCLFQISFALIYLQKNYQFTHNDLHINNIMFKKTEKKFLYYKFNNIYFKVPTFGFIFKMIDFGRSIFTFKNKTFMNDVFSAYGEAGGQYFYPSQVNFMNRKIPKDKIIQPNYNFDLCRLSMTILEEIDKTRIDTELFDFLDKMCIDCNKENFREMSDNFNLYISIAKNASNSLPRNIIQKKIFSSYKVPKKNFPLKSYYSL